MATFSADGAFTALVTPFVQDASRIDWTAYEALVERQIAGGIAGLVPCGTTGEWPTLSEGEQRELIKRTVELAANRALVVAGVSSNSTEATIAGTRQALELGVDAVMLVVPYYNKPSQAGIKAHFAAVARACPAKLIVYNVPGRSVASIFEDTLLELIDEFENIVALKDASNNVLYCQNLLSRVGRSFAVLSGDDALTLPMMSLGARGVVSVTSNVYPKAVADLVKAALGNEWLRARSLHFALLEAHQLMFSAPSPVPAKAALARKGLMKPALRLPLLELDPKAREAFVERLEAFERRHPEFA